MTEDDAAGLRLIFKDRWISLEVTVDYWIFGNEEFTHKARIFEYSSKFLSPRVQIWENGDWQGAPENISAIIRAKAILEGVISI